MVASQKIRPKKLKVIKLNDNPAAAYRKKPCAAIILKDVQEPRGRNAEEYIEWIFQCLGFGDRVAKEVFKELVKRSDGGVRSAEISERCKVTQGAVVYHLNTLMKSGLVVKHGRYYYLKRQRLDDTIEELEEEILRRFEKIKRIARLIENEIMRMD
ncbi:MAG: helix-turn-helix domain-containing protein [Candidatus Bilamarchaeaceae archaeon]